MYLAEVKKWKVRFNFIAVIEIKCSNFSGLSRKVELLAAYNTVQQQNTELGFVPTGGNAATESLLKLPREPGTYTKQTPLCQCQLDGIVG